MTLEEKINRLRESTEKYRANTNIEPQNSFEAEAKKVAEHEAEKNKQLADWLEELKRYRDLEEQRRLLVLPCGAGKDEKRLVDLEEAMDESTLYDWYVTSVKQTDTPVWTGKHIEELLNDFYVIPKEAALEKRRCEADGD